MKLNIGCGTDYKHEYINVDNNADFPGSKVDKNHDLDRFPYPFRGNSADEIYCNHVLEHLQNPRKVLREFHRILKPGGLLRLNVPYFTRGYMVHVHEHGFSKWSVLTDTKGLFDDVSVRFVWDEPSAMGRAFRPFCVFWNWVVNKNHWFTERFLAYSFGGIHEIRFELRKK